MRSPRAVSPVIKLLTFLALGALPQISASQAAAKCPRGEILRVSKGTCVPKAENLALLSRHDGKSAKAPDAELDLGPPPAKRAATLDASPNAPARAEQPDDTPTIRVAERDSPAEQPAPRPVAEAAPALSSPFGELFVGAFRSTLTMGLSAFK